MPIGRPSKLAPKRDAFLARIREGLSLQAAAARCAIDERTPYLWLHRGRNARRGEYFQFLQDFQAARNAAEALLLERILEASLDDWRAAGWILERRHPERYSVHAQIEHTGGQALTLSVAPADIVHLQQQRAKMLQNGDAKPVQEVEAEDVTPKWTGHSKD